MPKEMQISAGKYPYEESCDVTVSGDKWKQEVLKMTNEIF